MGAQAYSDDATPEMYCYDCADVEPTNNHPDWVSGECAVCEGIDLLYVDEAMDRGLLPKYQK